MRARASLLTAFLVTACGAKEEAKKDAASTSTRTATGTSASGPAEAVELTWQEPDADTAPKEYKIYVGASKTAKGELLGTAKSLKATFQIADENALRELAGGKACFTITAVLADGEGPASPVQCVDL